MGWAYLLAAIVSEVVGTSALKASAGFTRTGPAILVVAGFALAFYLLAQALKTMPLGQTYAIWAGLGTLLTSLVGWAYFGDPFHRGALVGTGLIIAGVMVLNLTGAKH